MFSQSNVLIMFDMLEQLELEQALALFFPLTVGTDKVQTTNKFFLLSCTNISEFFIKYVAPEGHLEGQDFHMS